MGEFSPGYDFYGLEGKDELPVECWSYALIAEMQLSANSVPTTGVGQNLSRRNDKFC